MAELTLHNLFLETCSKYPHRVAAIFDDGYHGSTLQTYGQVLETANNVTSLLSSLCKHSEIIGLYVEPCITLPAFILGVLQVPASYAPIDPQAPTSINKFFIEEVGISIICIQSCLLEHFASGLGQSFDWEPCHNVDQAWVSSSGLVPVHLNILSHKQHHCSVEGEGQFSSLAYALHTSGTTGRPKIVRVPHCCIVPNILDLRSVFAITEDDVVFMASPLTFDPSVVGMFMTWSQGASLLIVPTKLKITPGSLAQVLRRNHVTVLQATPSLISRFSTLTLRQHLLGASSAIRVLAFGGESCPSPSTIASWRGEGNQTEFFNLYGTTEVSSWASCFKIPEDWIVKRLDTRIPLGDALKDTVLQVLDETGQELNSGIGEPFIGLYVTKIVCKSVLHPTQTLVFAVEVHLIGEVTWQTDLHRMAYQKPGGYKRVCFLDNEEPFMSSGHLVMRATGDLVEVTKRGLIFLGRKDDQIKRHGKRISLLHIKQVIESCQEVASCHVIHTDDRLIAFYTSACENSKSTPASLEQSSLEDNSVNMEIKMDCLPKAIGTSESSSSVVMPIDRVMQPPRTIVDHLRAVLPSHAVPDRFVALQKLPITRHGKIDSAELKELLRKLEASEGERRVKLSIGGSGRWKEILSREWKDCLFMAESDAINDSDSFVRQGGDSFQALRLVQSLEIFLGTPLPNLMDVLLHENFFKVCKAISHCLPPIKCQSGVENSQDISDRNQKTDFDAEQSLQSSRIQSLQENATDCEDLFSDTGEESAPGIGTDIIPSFGRLDYIKSEIPSRSFENNDSNILCLKQSPKYLEIDHVTEIRKTDENVPFNQGIKRKLQTRDPIEDASSNKRSINPEMTSITSERVQSRPDFQRNTTISLRRGTQILHHNCYEKRKSLKDHEVFAEASVEQSEHSSKREKLYLEEKWKVDTGKCVDASPLVVCTNSSQTVFIGSHSHLFVAITVETGNVLWETLLGDRVESSACLSACGKYVIIGCYDHFVYCLSASTGDICWKYETGDMVKCSPVCDLTNGVVYIGSHDQHIVALHVEEEKYKTRWRSHCGGGSVFASPCIHHATESLIGATLRGNVIAFNKESGKRKWSFTCPKPVFSSPVATDDGILVGCVDGTMYCLSHTGIQLWTYAVNGPIFSSPCISPVLLPSPTVSNQGQLPHRTVVFGSHDGSVTCLDPSTGQHQWTSKVSTSPVYSTPFVFTQRGHSRVAVASTHGHVYILDLLTGKKMAEVTLPDEVFSSPIVNENKCLVVGCRNDYVYCLAFKETDKGV